MAFKETTQRMAQSAEGKDLIIYFVGIYEEVGLHNSISFFLFASVRAG
jgi:hypothetical protein